MSQPLETIQAWLVSQLSQLLEVDPKEIDIGKPLANYGLTSREAVILSGDLEDWLDRKVSPTLIYDYPTITALAQHLTQESEVSIFPSNSNNNHEFQTEPIAIIGMGCRFPGAESPETFWQILRDGADVITKVPPERWDPQAFYDPIPGQPGKMNTCWGGFLQQVDQFDPHFFGISLREAEQMDPQQRLLLEVAWEALEQAGQAPDRLAGSRTGVFVGISTSDYAQLQYGESILIDAYAGTGSAHSIAANRISYLLDLRGPSLAVDTACSSSLVAVHLACQSLRNGECRLALAGGVNLILSPELTIGLSQARMMASGGRCRTFDASADGYVRGEGSGLIVLKRLSDALENGDQILALIRGSAINQDGRTNGLTAPNGLAQQDVIRQALRQAEISPARISYVEAHGTGTSLGDPIELQALAAVLQEEYSKDSHCVVGSVKTNIGHLESAAGIAGLIKVVLCLKHKEIPPHVHLENLNPHIPLEKMPLTIMTERQPWLVGNTGRCAGVSSFGFGGTNAHVVLEEAPLAIPTGGDAERPVHTLALSAQSESALKELAKRYANFLAENFGLWAPDVCFTANTGRSHFHHRLAVFGSSCEALSSRLASFSVGEKTAGVRSGYTERRHSPKVAFLFTGQGSQYPGMGRQLYDTQPTFRQAMDRCDEILRPYLEQPLRSVLYSAHANSSLVNETVYTQSALFALEYALAELWQSWGIKPYAVLGHSIGEYVAACVAGVLSLEEGLKLTAQRAALMQSLPQEGQMALIVADEAYVAAAVAPYHGEVSIAAVNGPRNTVISGARASVSAILQSMNSHGIATRSLNVSHAFHSPLMESILDTFEHIARQINFQPPRIEFVSSLEGRRFEPGEVPEARYWRRHLREAVRFAEGMKQLAELGCEVFAELGPTPTLLNAGKRCLPEGSGTWLPSLKQGQSDWETLLDSLGALYALGADVDWGGFDHDYRRRRLSLPTYPFERRRIWLMSPATENSGQNKVRKTKELADQSHGADGASMLEGGLDAMQNETVNRAPAPRAVATVKPERKDEIRSILRLVAARLLRADPIEIDVSAPFLEMGADSIVLIDITRIMEDTFGIKVTVRQLFEEFSTLDSIAVYLDQNLAPDWASPDAPQPEPEPPIIDREPQRPSRLSFSSPVDPATTIASDETLVIRKEGITERGSALEQIIVEQLKVTSQLSRVLSQQLEVLGNHRSSTDTSLLPRKIEVNGLNQSVSSAEHALAPSNQPPTTVAASPTAELTGPTRTAAKPSGLYRPIKPAVQEELSPQQQRRLEELIAEYTRRTQKSKQLTQAYRPVHSDRRTGVGFRFALKEMHYPIIAERSLGSRIWDVDGNEYIDITMGFGVHLFGHSAPFISEAILEQLQQGTHLGPQSNLAGEVATLISEMTGMERVAFCNSGTEAVMTALRLARTVTGRAKIAIFDGAYHGHFDGTLVRAAQSREGTRRSLPLVPGVPQNIAEDVLVLSYGEPQSLDIIRAHGRELAAVLVEPVQSRRPDLQPKAFLEQLRQLTQELGVALIFDEMITGFRIHPGGVQAWFGVQADLATYGKIIGGGLPLGVVAGKSKYLDAIDGGLWNYGDSSYPQAETTFFAGTFCKNPLSMAAARAALNHLKARGPALQRQLNQRTSQLAETLNDYFECEEMPIRVEYFGSLFLFVFSGNFNLIYQPIETDLLNYHLIKRGVYIWEGRTCYLSTAHTDEDIEYVIQAVRDSLQEMRAGGFLRDSSSGASMTSKPSAGTSSGVAGAASVAGSAQGAMASQTPSASSARKNEKEAPNSAQGQSYQPHGFWERRQFKPSLTTNQRPALNLKAISNTGQGAQFSLVYFGSYPAEFDEDKYSLLLESARFADRNGFTALWIPERHFHSFGGLSPSPAVISAALARETERIQMRAGSVVLPLHHPIQIAEEWSVVDNLSSGRVGISFASGWHADDFVFAPESYGNHREIMFQGIEIVRKLWRGEPIQVRGGAGNMVEVKLFPLPRQPELPTWITIVNNPETYLRAAETGAGVFTNLMGQTVEELAKNIAAYRESLSMHGYDPASGNVTVLLHTFIGDNLESVRQQAFQPFCDYLRSSVGLFQNLIRSQRLQNDLDRLREDDMNYLLSIAYERYVQTSALIGTPESCAKIIDDLIAIGVNEIACFIDFGVAADSVLASLPYLNVLRERYQNRRNGSLDASRPSLIQSSRERSNNLKSPLTSLDSEPAAATAARITRQGEESVQKVLTAPLTEAQKQLWVLTQIGEDRSRAYNEMIAVQLLGPLRAPSLRQAFQMVVDRHEALRTIINGEDGVQQILPAWTINVPVIDFSGLEVMERETKVSQWLREEGAQCFDFAKSPPLRVSILKLEEQRHLLALTTHHILVDGWSMGVLLEEVGAFYSAANQDAICQLEPPMQFRDYAQWRLQQVQAGAMVADESYWVEKFSKSIPYLELPTDHPRPPVKTYCGNRQSGVINKSLCSDLKKLSQQQRCTLFMTLLATYMSLLHRLTGQDEIVIGTPVFGRSLKGAERLVGYCAHLMPVRSRLIADTPFTEYLASIRSELLADYEHQNYPFALLINKLNLPRDLSRTPLVAAVFNMERHASLEMSGLEIELVSPTVDYARFDIVWHVTELGGELRLEVVYNADLFDVATINRMMRQFETLLSSIVAQPDASLSHLRDILTRVERRRQELEQKDYEAASFDRFKSLKPRIVNLLPEELIKLDYLERGQTQPLVLRPVIDDIDLADWIRGNREFIERELLKHGAILFRDFQLDSATQFEQVAMAVCPELFGEYGDLPRSEVGGKVYGSTPYPSDQAILFHNESSHMHQWPLKILFFCMEAATQGGETVIADCRKIYQLLDPKIRARLNQMKVLYVRNYIDGLDVGWQEFFRTNDKTVVEEYCRKASMDFDWRENHGLRTRRVCPAIAQHPKTGESVFFNQLQLHHPFCLDPAVRQSLLSLFKEEEFPRNVYYGDGSPIEVTVMEEVVQLYCQTAVSLPWQPGDVLLLDNMLTAHGRNPYLGSRKVVVAMGQIIEDSSN